MPLAIFTSGLLLLVGAIFVLPALPSTASGARLAQALLVLGLLGGGTVGFFGLIQLQAVESSSGDKHVQRGTWVALAFGLIALCAGGGVVGYAAKGVLLGVVTTPLWILLSIALPVARTLFRLGHRAAAWAFSLLPLGSMLLPIMIAARA